MIKLPLSKLLFVDIETVGAHQDFESCQKENPLLAEQFIKYFDWFIKRFPEDSDLLSDNHLDNLNTIFSKRAALVPEFNKIVCVSLAFVMENGEIKKQSYSNKNEKELLKSVKTTLDKCHKMDFYLCGHNVKNFDIPVIAKRMIVNGILPSLMLPSFDVKPWEMKVIDTKDIWQYGSFNSIGSLELLCVNLGIETPKSGNISGQNVHDEFYKGNINDIVKYCEKDVEVLIQIVKKLKELE
jgi:hypothetical protein